jgi:hypothetical protein
VLDGDRHVRGHRATTARTSSCAIAGSRISAEPHSPATTRLAGQPMLMSTSDAPIATAIRAPLASLGSRPKICTPNGGRRGARSSSRWSSVAAVERVRRQELGDGEPGAELLAHGAEREVGHRRHRREEHWALDFDLTDSH